MTNVLEKIIASPDKYSFEIERLGDCKIDSPVRKHEFVKDDERIFITENRSFYKRLIDDGKVSVNGKVITKAGTKLSAGDVVEADIPEPTPDDSFIALS